MSHTARSKLTSRETDEKLVDLLTEMNVAAVEDVIAIMRAIDALLPNEDGLKWFNALYLMVTCSVGERSKNASWQDAAWLDRLDVVFAKLYFAAIVSTATGDPSTPRSWNALFEARGRQGTDRIQFALAGMNAHINHDLAIALLKTNQELKLEPDLGSAEHADYEAVNDLLEAVLPETLTLLADGVLGQIAQDSGKVGRLLAIWNIKAARDMAWNFSAHLATLSSIRLNLALTMQDQLTGALGRSLLLVA